MSQDMVSPEDLIKNQIANMRNRVAPPKGGSLSTVRITQDKKFVFTDDEGNERKVDGPVEVVLLDFINQNQFYKTSYSKGSNDEPDCWAQAWNIDDMAPDPELVKEPVAKTCSECPMMEWGSGPNNSRACKNRRKVAFKLPGDPKTVYLLSVSPTGVAKFDSLMAELADRNTPMSAVVMEMGFGNKDWAVVEFTPVRKNDDFEDHIKDLPAAQRVLASTPKKEEKESK